jgi:hypothetical protein
LYETKHLEIKFDVFESEELTKQQNSAENQQNSAKSKHVLSNYAESKHVFETLVDVSFFNEEDRRSIEGYIFKLFDDLIE